MTGSAIAIPLLGATGASAASGATWDKIAECESGGSWSANTGNGRYGGLQLSQEDWDKRGGLEYAPSPDQASRSQQIAIAEKVLADEGVGAWPTCGLLHGLGEDSASGLVDTGAVDESSNSPDSSGQSGSSGSSESPESSSGVTEGSAKRDSGSSDPSGDASQGSGGAGAAKGDDSDNSGQGGDSSSGGEGNGGAGSGSGSGSGSDYDSGSRDATSGAGRHRGGSADESAGGGADGSADSTGRHASRDGNSARGAEGTDGTYIIREGDNLWAIADSLGLEGGWPELYAENKETVGTDPNLILPGQMLYGGVESGEK